MPGKVASRWAYWIYGWAVRNRNPLAYRMFLRYAPQKVRLKHTFYSRSLVRRDRKARKATGSFDLGSLISKPRRRQLRLLRMERERKGWPQYKSYLIRQALRD